jgi:hypothetical protein
MKTPGRYERLNGIPVMVRSGVLFMDALGTSARALSPNAQSTIQKLDNSIRQARYQSQLDEEWTWTDSGWFSDHVAIAAPLGDDDDTEEGIFGTILLSAIWLQFRLAIDDFFTRGGFVVGQHFMDDRVNFGPALVKAHLIEEQEAIYPRIVLDHEAIETAGHHAKKYASGASPFEKELMVDVDDDRTFVSYLSVTEEADDDDEALGFLSRHRQAVIAQLNDPEVLADSSILDKYRWSADYHNAYSRWFAPQLTTLLVPTTWLARRFRRYQIPED